MFEIPLDKSKAKHDAVEALLEKHGFEEKDVIYTTQKLTEIENQETKYEVPDEMKVPVLIEDAEDGTEFEYIIK